jgi:hypothetical protein
MKLKSPYWLASCITFVIAISSYVGLMLCGRATDSSILSLGAYFVFLSVVGALAFLASLVLWFLAAITSVIRSRPPKS